jgi:hypothetical protein
MSRPLSGRQREILHVLSTLHLTGVPPVANEIGRRLDPPLEGKNVTTHLRRMRRAGKIERYGRTSAGNLWRRTPT